MRVHVRVTCPAVFKHYSGYLVSAQCDNQTLAAEPCHGFCRNTNQTSTAAASKLYHTHIRFISTPSTSAPASAIQMMEV